MNVASFNSAMLMSAFIKSVGAGATGLLEGAGLKSLGHLSYSMRTNLKL